MRLAESDFRSIEADGMLDVSILISGGSTQEFGDVVFNVTALTKQQFAGVLGEELCRNNVTLPTSASTRPADGKYTQYNRAIATISSAWCGFVHC